MIVGVLGGVADVGTSTVALNLGRELEAVVVDADLAFADRRRGRGPDFQDVLAGRAAPIEAVVADGPVRVLPCGRSLADARIERPAFESTLEALAEEFDRVVVDCPTGTGDAVVTTLRGVDSAVVVTTTDHRALVAAARTKRLALETDTPIGAVVCNRTSPAPSPSDDERARAIERGLGEPVIELLERSTIRVARASARPVRDVAPGDDAVERFASLAAALEPERPSVDAPPA